MQMMIRFGLFIAAVFAATLAGGCAAPNGTQKAADDEEKVYVTGSRIPVKDKVHGPVTAVSDRKSIEDMVRRPGTFGSSGN
jgi:hypothetical protein